MSSGIGTPGRPATEDDPFRLGWRYVREVGPDGRETSRQVPLTLRDLLFPQEGDFVVQCDAHIRDWVYLREAFRMVLRQRKAIHVFADHRIDFNIPEVEPLGPDLALIDDLPDWDGTRGTLYLAREGRPLLVVEVTSPETRKNDLGVKVDFYQAAAVPFYVIVDRCAGVNADEVVVGGYYLDSTGTYQTLARTAAGWVWIEAVGVFLGIEAEQVWAYNRAGQRVEEAAQLVEHIEEARRALEEAETLMAQEVEARQAAERARREADTARQEAEKGRRDADTARRDADTARQEAERARREMAVELANEAEAHKLAIQELTEFQRRVAQEAAAQVVAQREIAEQLVNEAEARKRAEKDAADQAETRRKLEDRLRELEEQLRRSGRSIMTPAFLFLLLAGSLPDGPVPPEIHGRWRVTKEVVDRTPTDEGQYKNLVIEIDAGTLRLRDGDAVLECTARANANLRTLAITPRKGPKMDRPFGALYFVSDDLLTIALKRDPDREVPSSISPGSTVVVLHLKREK